MLPFAVAAAFLVLGYLRYALGTAHPDDYLADAWEHLRFSDVIWLWVRDSGASHPVPYLDHWFEYPVLLGGLIYLLGFAPSLGAYFALTYAVLAGCALATIALLRRLPGADPWYLAAAPALYLYTGLNWDTAAIAATAAALVAFDRGRDRWGTIALVAAVWLKFFPLVFLAAILVERLRRGRRRAALEIAGLFALGSLVVNLPVLLAAPGRWADFFTFNRDRAADSNLWVLARDIPTSTVNALSLAALAIGGLGLAVLALRSRRSVVPPLGAALLLWWLAINKVFSPQYALWVFFALAVLRPSWSLWTALVAADLAAYAVGFFVQYALHRPEGGPFADWQIRHLYDPLQVLRVGLLLLAIGSGMRLLLQEEGALPAASMTVTGIGGKHRGEP